jgi:hypothetical protein
LLARGELEAFATNKPILFEMSASLPGGRVLDGNWGQEHIAIAIPKGRDKGMEYVRHIVDDGLGHHGPGREIQGAEAVAGGMRQASS